MSEKPTSPLDESQLPARAAELRDLHRCPACLSALEAVVCTVCGLDLAHPLAHELAAASEQAAGALERRAALLARIRSAAATPVAAVPAPATAPAPAAAVAAVAAPAAAASIAAAPAALPAVPAPASPAPASPGPTTPGPASPAWAAPAAPAPEQPQRPADGPRRSSVQIVLVVIGVSLLGTFAIFGLVYAFINYGIVARSLIVGGATIAAIAVATILRSRRLRATGEGIAALGALLVLLDAWAIRENDFFGAGAAPGALYWGVALLTTAVLFVVWGRLARLRVPTVAGHALLVPGAGVLAGGLLDELDGSDGAAVAFGAAAAALAVSVAHRLLAPRDRSGRPAAAALPERIVMGIQGLAALPPAGIAALLVADGVPGAEGAGTLALLGVALLAGALAATMLGVPDARGATRALGAIAAVGAVVALVAAPLPLAFRFDSPSLAIAAPLLVAAAAALAGELLLGRLPSRSRAGVLAAAIAAAALGAFAALGALGAAALPVAQAFGLLLQPGAGLATATDAPEPVSLAGLLALVGVLLLAAGAWALRGRLGARRAVLLGAALLLAILAAPFARVHGVVLLLWLLVAAGALLALGLRRRRGGDVTAVQSVLAAAAVGAAALAYAACWTAPAAWIGTSAAILVLLPAGRLLLPGPVRSLADAALLGVAAVLAGRLVAEYGEPAGSTAVRLGVVLAVIAVAALGMIAGSLLPGRLLHAAERRTLFWTGTAVAVAAWAVGLGIRALEGTGGSAPLLAAATAAVPLLAWSLWHLLPQPGLPPAPGSSFRAERGTASALLAPALAAALVPALEAAGLTPAPIALLVGCSALLVAAVAMVRAVLGAAAQRIPSEAGAGAVALLALLAPVADPRVEPWLVLLPAALVALVTAISRDGLVESSRPRKHLGWAALGLGTLALWTRLGASRVEEVEAYTLPLAGAIVVIAVLVRWRAPRRADGSAPASTPYLIGAALLLALVPSALAADPAAPARGIAAAAATTALLALGALTGGASSRIGSRADRLVAYLVAVAGATALLAAVVLRGEAPLEWLGVGAVALLAAASALSRLLPPPAGAAPLAWTALGLAAIGALVLLARGLADPLEWIVLPVAAALLLPGAVALARDGDRRSWPQLGPGLGAALLPSLVAAYVDDPLWRVVAVGVAALAAVVLGLALRLQAPFLIGTGVLLWHLVTQLWTQLGSVYRALPWWLWLGIAGVIVIAVAIRYEQRLNNLKSVVRSIGQLR